MKKYSKTEFLSVLKPYFIIATSVLLIMLVFFNLVLSSFRNEINNNYSRSTAFFSKSIDEKLHITEDYANALIFSNSVSRINRYDSSGYSDVRVLNQAYDVVYNIRRFITSNALIDDIYIYYPDSDLMIGRHGFYNSRTYYALTLDNKYNFISDNNYPAWMDSLFFTDQQRYFTAKLDSSGIPEAFFREKTPEHYSDKRIIVVKLDSAYIEDMMSQLFSSTNYRFIGLVDENDTIYASAGDKNVFYDSTGDNLNGRKYISNVSESEIWGMKCVAFQEYDSVYKALNIATIITTAGFIFSIIVSAVLSLRYSSKHVKTINKISDRLSDSDTDMADGSLSYIEKRIDEILDEKNTAIGESSRQQITIEKLFFKELLLTKNISEDEIRRKCSRYGIDLEHPVYSLIIIPSCGKSDQYFEDLVKTYTNDEFRTIMTNGLDGNDIYLCNYTTSGKATFTSLVQKIKRNYNDSGKCRVLRGGVSLADVLNMWSRYQEESSCDIEEKSEDTERSGSASVVETVHSIIENEYTNPQLGLGMLAERLNISQPYLSKQFKNRYGIGINSYINTLRITAARQYLENDDYTVSEIAVKVGYTNDVNFIRVFKKYENITPGNYRASVRDDTGPDIVSPSGS